MKPITIVALSGSFRSGSTNTALLRAAAEEAPEGVTLTLHDYRDVPLYDGDIAEEPPGVARLKAAIAGADGVLLAVPEYNHSMPGVLKNAIDWASRPAFRSGFMNKPTAVVSAAASFVGGARGQQHAKLVLLGMGALVYPGPELLVGTSHQKVQEGVLTDEVSRRFLREFMVGFGAFAGR